AETGSNTRNTILGTVPDCGARNSNGQATVPPRRVKNSRRLIGSLHSDRKTTPSRHCCLGVGSAQGTKRANALPRRECLLWVLVAQKSFRSGPKVLPTGWRAASSARGLAFSEIAGSG